MKNLFKILIAGFTVLLMSSCSIIPVIGSGHIVTENRSLPAFNMINLEGQGDILASTGSTPGLSIRSDDNIVGEIETIVVNGELRIQNKNFQYFLPTNGITLEVVMTEQPVDIDISGTGSFNWTDANPIESPSLSLDISGCGDINLEHVGTRLNLDISGSGNAVVTAVNAATNSTISGSGSITYHGSSTNTSVDISGSGEYSAFGFTTVNTDVTISGSGSAYVYASGTLSSHILGSGSVFYRGGPAVSSSGGGIGTVSPG